MNKRKTLNDLKVGDEVFYIYKNELIEIILELISLRAYKFKGFEERNYYPNDLTRWNIEVVNGYNEQRLIHFNKIDALKELKKIKTDSFENYKKEFDNFLEEIKNRQQKLFELDLEILKENQQ
jgi:phenylpropionate dioxygenase-like ring-hydroxylating dioxygenase large terminal subunit